MAASMKDIANKLNISLSTVSYALNNGPREVHPDVKQKILALASELNYRPNRLAQSMASGRTNMIGVVLPQLMRDALLSSYLHHALNGVSNEAEELGQDILLFTGHGSLTADGMFRMITDRRTDGVIFIAPDPPHLKAVGATVAAGFPCVTISNFSIPSCLNMGVDNEGAVRIAMDYLTSLGHDKIAHIAGRKDHEDGARREEEYRRYLIERGFDVPERRIAHSDFTTLGGYRAMTKILAWKERPTAIFCANDEMAIGAVAAAADCGFSVPNEISVMGFDGTNLSQMVRPTITTMRQPVEEICSAAVRALVGTIEGRQTDEKTLWSTELTIGGSTGPAPCAISTNNKSHSHGRAEKTH
jgi:LacI family transcriptional regulator